jgi:hypothetical protein
MGYGTGDAIDGFSYRLWVGVDILGEQCSVGPILSIVSRTGSGMEVAS